jgi:carbamoyltransferase
MYILGISCYYHDASATLVKDGIVVAAAEEERFTRKKHDVSFPKNSIEFCLKKGGININEVDYVAFYEKPFLKFERVIHQHLESFPLSLKTFLSSMPSWMNEKLRILKKIKKIGFKKDVFFVEHHLAHAASAFFPSPFAESAIVTIDGVGEWSTTTYGSGKENKIQLNKEIKFPHSLGLLYSTITAYLGFSVNNSEYKVMGLAPYGDMNRKTNPFYNSMKKLIDLKDDGSFSLDMSYFTFHWNDKMPSKKLCRLFGGPITKRNSEMNIRHKNIAAALQLVTEDVIFKILNNTYKKIGSENIVLAGGVTLNSVANGKIIKNTPFKNIWIQPNASDGGTSMGAALYAYNSILGNKRNYRLKTAYSGPQFSVKEIKNFLDSKKINYHTFQSYNELIETTSNLLAKNNVIGWFMKGMEWGPRALGARSILANPCNPNAQKLLNEKVKHREKFRPFAPAVCEDDASEYFDCDTPIPEPTDFMLMVYPVREKWKSKIPSVTHVDGSGRLQTVRREQNIPYYDLLKRFGKKTGIPILINTSFNIRGEPIVCTPEDAYRCMMGTEIDYLVINKFLIKRSKNSKDIWDSEKLAND